MQLWNGSVLLYSTEQNPLSIPAAAYLLPLGGTTEVMVIILEYPGIAKWI